MGRYSQCAGYGRGGGTVGQPCFHLQHITAGSKTNRIRSPIGRILADQLVIQLLVLGICRTCLLYIDIVALRITHGRPLDKGRFIPTAAAGNGYTCGMCGRIDEPSGQ
ncbi:hypothetical protein D3C75_1067520 [compost metagenome]